VQNAIPEQTMNYLESRNNRMRPNCEAHLHYSLQAQTKDNNTLRLD